MVVSQLHTFTLSDVMRVVRKANASVDGVNMVHTHLRAARGVAEKLAHLAKAKVIKLSLTPKSVVFASSNIVLKHSGFEWKEFKNLAGSPFLVDYSLASHVPTRARLGLQRALCACAHGYGAAQRGQGRVWRPSRDVFPRMVGRDASGSKLYELASAFVLEGTGKLRRGAAQANFYSCLSYAHRARAHRAGLRPGTCSARRSPTTRVSRSVEAAKGWTSWSTAGLPSASSSPSRWA